LLGPREVFPVARRRWHGFCQTDYYYYAVFFNAESAENAENGCQGVKRNKETA